MYMPGRLRTASRPSRTLIERASYDKVEAPLGTDTRGRRKPPPPPWCTYHFTWEHRQAQPYVSRGPRLSRTRHWPGCGGAAGPRTLTLVTAAPAAWATPVRLLAAALARRVNAELGD